MSESYIRFLRRTKRLALVAMAAWLLLPAWQSQAQTTLVINSSNANFTTLANDLAIGGNIFLNFNGTLAVTSPLTVATNTTIFTTGTNQAVLSGGGSNRIFQVLPNVTLVLSNLVLSGGNQIGSNGVHGANGGTSGGGSQGTSGGGGGNGGNGLGGAVFNQGNTIAYYCLFLTNRATGGTGGTGGSGGAGSVTVGNGGSGGGGGTAQGGAIFNMGSLGLTNCVFSGNGTIAGNGGAGGTGGSNSFSVGASGSGGSGGVAQGAGFYNSNQCQVTVVGCTFEFNFGEAGNSQAAGPPGGNGTGATGPTGAIAQGGGICNAGTNIIINSTFAQNLVVGGNGGNGGGAGSSGIGGNGGNGGNAYGGGFYNNTGALAAITNCTFADGESFGGTNGIGGSGSHNAGNNGSFGSSLGANIGNAGTLLFKNSILAYPSNALNSFGTLTDQDNNISSDASAGFTQTNSYNNLDPLLLPLGNNGGPTPTVALQSGSPAIDKIFDGSAPTIDQRGNARPFGPRPDMGAYEFGTATFSLSGVVVFSGGGLSNILIDANGEFETVTASNGSYTLSGLPAGSYVITPSSTNFTFTPATYSLTVSSTTSNVNFVASATLFKLGGQLTISGTTNVLTNFAVVLSGSNLFNNTVSLTNTTDTNGNYSFSNLLNGIYNVAPLSLPGIFFSTTNANFVLTTNTIVNFTAILLDFNITGTVKLGTNGAPYSNVTILATNTIGLTNIFATTTDSTGAYAFNGLPAGFYILQPQPFGFFNPTNAFVTLFSNANANFVALGANMSISNSSGSQVTLTLAGSPNVKYRIQASTNLTTWQDISTNTAGTNGAITFSTSTNGFTRRFFRVVTP